MVVLKRIDGIAKTLLLKSIRNLKDKAAKVGWFSKSRYPDTNISVAFVAAQNEYGNPLKHIPARPFLRPTILEQENIWRKVLSDGAYKILANQSTPELVMEKVGLLAAGDIRKKISQIYEPPLSPVTIYNRLHRKNDKKTIGALDKPLIDTGVMYDTLTVKVETI